MTYKVQSYNNKIEEYYTASSHCFSSLNPVMLRKYPQGYGEEKSAYNPHRDSSLPVAPGRGSIMGQSIKSQSWALVFPGTKEDLSMSSSLLYLNDGL